MGHIFYRRWLIMALKGILAIILGIIALFYPALTVSILAVVFSIFLLIGGTIALISAWRNRKFNPYWTHWLLGGVLDLIIGLLLLLNPHIPVTLFLGLIALWAIIEGLILLFSYFRFRRHVTRHSVILFASLISLFFGLTVLFNPAISTIALSVLIGLYAIFYGIFSVLTAIKLTQT